MLPGDVESQGIELDVSHSSPLAVQFEVERAEDREGDIARLSEALHLRVIDRLTSSVVAEGSPSELTGKAVPITVSTTKANDAAKSGDSADVDSSATASDAPKEEDAAGEVNRDEMSSSDSGVSSDAQSSTSTEQGQGKESSDGSANEGITP